MNQITETGRARCRAAQAAGAVTRTTRTQDAIMTFLRDRAVGAQSARIAIAVERDRSTVARNLRQLTAAGRVEGFADPHDARTRRYRLTPQELTR